VKNSSKEQQSGWNVSFWFAVTSPLLGIVLAVVILAVFQPST
jgi:hypothetical protein